MTEQFSLERDPKRLWQSEAVRMLLELPQMCAAALKQVQTLTQYLIHINILRETDSRSWPLLKLIGNKFIL